MPQNEAKFQVNQFTGGLNTDANPIADAGPTSRDEANCEILPHGGRRRRRGFTPEVASVASSVVLTSSQKEDYAFSVSDWKDAGGVGGLDFCVYQEGPTLYFYAKGTTPLSAGRKTFSVNLQSFKTAAASTADVEQTLVSMASGKGALFVCGAAIEPFYVEYNQTTDSITTTQVTIQIRDFEELSTSVGVKDEVAEPALTGEHLYDLLNQGWYQTGPYLRDDGSTNRDSHPVIELYRSVIEFLPRKNTPWHLGKYLVAEDSGRESNAYISPQQVRSSPSGNTPSPSGHYILDAFNKDRRDAVVSGGDDWRSTWGYFSRIDNVAAVTEDERPVAVAFYAGRVWWALKNSVYFSQLLDTDDLSGAGKCYQDGDPTSEGESDIIATDGGLIPVSGMGRATSLAVTGTSIVVLADNGVWAIQGAAGDSFTAVDFSVNRLSTLSCRSPGSVVEAEGLVFFWGDNGVYVVQPGEVRDQPVLRDLVEGRITEFYNAVPQNSKRNCSGFYDPADKVIYWMYRTATDSTGVDKNRFAFDRFLNFSLKFSAWFPWTTSVLSTAQIMGGTVAGGVSSSISEVDVVDSLGAAVTDSGSNTVTVNQVSSVETTERVKFMALNNDSALFAEARSLTFKDWPQINDGTDYSSYIETFYHLQDDTMAYMQAPYTYAYFKRTDETPTAVDAVASSFSSYITGTWDCTSGSVLGVAEKSSTGLTSPRHPSNAPIIKGEDGNLWTFQHGGSGVGADVSTIRLYRVDDPTTEISITGAEIDTAANTAGDDTALLTDFTSVSVAAIPGTAYLLVVGHAASGGDDSKLVCYIKVNSSSSIEYVGGFSLFNEDLTASQNSPTVENSSSFAAVGYINGAASTNSSNPTVLHEYPVGLAFHGESKTSVWVLPSINAVINGEVESDSGANAIDGRQLDLAATFGDNLFETRDAVDATVNSRAVIVPRGDTLGGNMYVKIYENDRDRHAAGTETRTNIFIDANATSISDGWIAKQPINYSVDLGNALDYTTSAGTVVTNDNASWTDFPFTDETDDYAGASGTADVNYTCAPAAFPTSTTSITQPWVMFFPKVFEGSPGSFEVKAYYYDPLTEVAVPAGSVKCADVVTFGEGNDVSDATAVPQSVSVYWDQTNGNTYLQVFYGLASGNAIATILLGTFTPGISGVDDFFTGLSGSTFVESSCILNTRWDWSNNAVSGKVSPDIQIYRGGRLRIVDDTSNPGPTGLPVYVSKNKTRGRGRSLQLRFRSETGKDFELYGWSVWAAKNTRF